MLEPMFVAKMQDGEEIKIAHVICNHCTNVFFVPAIGENEPSFCCYCGSKFAFYENAGRRKSLGGKDLE